MRHATNTSAVSVDDASASAATGNPIAYPTSRQNRTVPTDAAKPLRGEWSAAAAASTGYMRPVKNPRRTPERTRYPNWSCLSSSGDTPTPTETRPRHPAPTAATSSAAAPPSKPRMIGAFLPILSDIIPASSCDRPLTKE